MADNLDDLVNGLKEQLNEAGKMVKTFYGENFGPGTDKHRTEMLKSTAALGIFGAAVLNSEDGLKKLATGSYTTADALGGLNGMFNTVFSHLGPVGAILGKLGTTATGAVNAMIAVNDSLRNASKTGVYFGNNLGEYSLTLAKARMSTSAFEKMLVESSQSVGSFGYSMDSGAKRYLQATKEFQENSQVETLIKTGVGMDELNKTMLLFGSRMTRSGKTQEDFTKFLADGAAKFATQMDDISRITGISKEQQQKTLDLEMQRAENLQFQLRATPEQIAQLKEITNQMEPYGQEIQQLAEEMYRNNGQVMSNAGRETMGKIGSAGGATLQEMSRAKARGDDAAVKELQAKFNQQMQAFVTSKAATGLFQTTDMGKTFQPFMQNVALSEKQLAEEAAERKISIDEMRKIRDSEIKADREKAAAAKPADTQAAAVALNSANRLMADSSIAVTGTFNNLNQKLGGTINEFDAFTKALRFRPAAELETMLPGSKKKEEVKRDTGSLGKVGSLLEDWGRGTTVTLHGMEGIVTADQFKMMGEGISNTIKDVSINSNDMDSMLRGLGVNDFGSSISKSIQRDAVASPAPAPKKDLFDDITDIFYDVGNMAGKMFDDVKKTTPSNMFYNIGNVAGKMFDDFTKTSAKSSSPTTKINEQRTALDKDIANQRKESERVKLEAERKKQEEQKLAEAKKLAETTKKEAKPEEAKGGGNASMNDLRDQLIELNKNVKDLITHTDRVAEHTGEQNRIAKKGGSRI